MSRRRATLLSAIGFLAGGGLLFYLMRNISPYDAEQQLNAAALLAFMAGVFLLASGAGGLLALLLHRRWPALAGVRVRQRNKPPPSETALRQGILIGLVAVTLIALTIVRVLDVAVLIVTLLVAGLVEAYAQNRK